MASTPKSELPVAFRMVADEADPAVMGSALAAAPLIPRKLLPRVAPRICARRAARVHGSARP